MILIQSALSLLMSYMSEVFEFTIHEMFKEMHFETIPPYQDYTTAFIPMVPIGS